jgi:hypothetical protein
MRNKEISESATELHIFHQEKKMTIVHTKVKLFSAGIFIGVPELKIYDSVYIDIDMATKS